MKIEKFEDIQAWQQARKLTQMVYALSRKPEFSKDFGLVNQIRSAAGSSMHNVVEGFDAESNAEFIRFLRYAKRSCAEVQSELYVALDEGYISQSEFKTIYEQAGKTRATVRGFINYLTKFENEMKGKQQKT
jgi:four helix bundle protein